MGSVFHAQIKAVMFLYIRLTEDRLQEKVQFKGELCCLIPHPEIATLRSQ